jgi:hypothetical protein
MHISNLISKQTNHLAEIIADNFDSSFLIPLSAHYSAGEWNTAMHQAIAVLAKRNGGNGL